MAEMLPVLAPSGVVGEPAANRAFRERALVRRHMAAQSARAGSGGQHGIVIDLTDLMRLAHAYNGGAATLQTGRAAVSRGINFGIRKLQTRLKYKVKDWTGIRNVGEVTKGFKPKWSSPATLVGVLRVEDRHRAITAATYGASWARGSAGGRHAAWNRGQTAKGTFMIPGAAPLFHRTGSGRSPIRPIYGANFAREIERHKPEVETLMGEVGLLVHRETVELLRLAITGSRKG